MGEKSNFDAGAAFDESLQKRISTYERRADRAKRAWHSAEIGSKIAGSATFVDIPEFKLQRKFDEETGRVSYEIGQSTRRIRTPHLEGIKRLKRRAYYEASGYIHKKISENEQDNTGVEAAHKIEQAGEEAAANLKNMLPSGRSVSRKLQQSLERQAQKKKQEYQYSLFQKEMAQERARQNSQTFISSKPGADSGIVARKESKTFGSFVSKKGAKEASKEAGKEVAKSEAKNQSKKMMRRAVREAQKEAAKKSAQIAAAKSAEAGAEAAATTATAGTAATAGSMATGVGEYILLAEVIIFIVILLIILLLIAAFLIFTQVQLQQNVMAAMYQSEPEEIEKAELYYGLLEANLSEYIENIDSYEPDYDGYVIDYSDPIGHNPYTLINYLSAKYEEFTFDDVKSEIESLYAESYSITTWVEELEITPEEDTDPEESEEEEEEDEDEEPPPPMKMYILHISLTRTPLEDIVADRMDDEQTETYNLYAETRGGFSFIKSPIDGNYMGNISSYYGYRYHPIHEEIRLHRGLDIALPEGTGLYAGIDGTITVGDDPGGYGNYVTITGEDGVQVRYAHMSNIYVHTGDTVKKGDIFGESGNTGASTGPHVHVEVILDGNYYNPLFYLDTE